MDYHALSSVQQSETTNLSSGQLPFYLLGYSKKKVLDRVKPHAFSKLDSYFILLLNIGKNIVLTKGVFQINFAFQ